MKCSLCGFAKTRELLNLGRQPLANKYPTPEQRKGEDFYPMRVMFCPQCKNVQLSTIIDRGRMFEDYYYLSSVNPGLVRHFTALAKKLSRATFVVDIGSNDGILLKPLKESGVKAIGIDPSVNVGKMANDAGLTTVVSFFNAAAVKKTVSTYGKPDFVVASSIFTHVEDPHQFIEDLKNLLTPDGRFILEVEYVGAILDNVQFERFYFDRPYYYSLTSLVHLFDMHGMRVADVETISPHGGSLRVTARMNAGKPTKRVVDMLAKEKRSLTEKKLEAFRKKAEKHIAAFRAKLEKYKKAGLRVAGYSAPARVSTICNFGKIGPKLIEFIVDDSPLKQNRFSPGTHIPIVPKNHLDSLAEKPDVLVVFAYEYLSDIKKKTANNKYRYLIPIPPREA